MSVIHIPINSSQTSCRDRARPCLSPFDDKDRRRTDPQHHHQRVELPGQKGHQIQKGIAASDPIVPGTIGLNPLRIQQQADATDYSSSGDFSRIFMAWQNGHILSSLT